MRILIPKIDQLYRLMEPFTFTCLNTSSSYGGVVAHFGGQIAIVRGYARWQINLPSSLFVRFGSIKNEYLKLGVFKKDNPNLPVKIGFLWSDVLDVYGMNIEEIHYLG